MFFAFFKKSDAPVTPSHDLEQLEKRTLMSASPVGTIGIGPPPTGGGATAVVQTLSPQQTETGTPQVTVVVNVTDQAPPKPPETIEIKFVKIEIAY